MAQSREQSTETHGGSSRQQSQSVRILLVEDSLLQQKLVAVLLKQLGHAVSVASDGFEALSAVQWNDPYDVILMDCQMSLMDGFQTTKFIRQLERRNGTRTTIIGISTSASRAECIAAGMDEFLKKPLNKSILKVAIGRRVECLSNRASAITP